MSDFTRKVNEVTTQAPPPASGPEAGVKAARPFAPDVERRPRLWPAVLIVAAMLLMMFAPTIAPTVVEPATMMHIYLGFYGLMVAWVLLVLWWLAASRLRWYDRLLGVAAFLLPGVAVFPLAHEKSQMAVVLYGLPAAATALVLWLLVSSPLSWPARRIGLLVTSLLVCGAGTLLRYDGARGDMSPQISWRWSQTEEDRYLAEIPDRATVTAADTALKLQPGDWPGFRGADRDGRLTGARVNTDWSKPPRPLWRQRIGPGWSSFAVIGDRVFTQEQRGKLEVVVCLDAATGKQVWAHEDEVRFDEAVGGPGPRATPTFHDGKLYTLGAKGMLNCLDAATGKKPWARDIKDDSGATVPQWGFSSSPLVVAGLVMAHAGGPDGKAVVAYHADSGQFAWASGQGQYSYSSPQLAKLGGVEQVLIITDAGLTGLEPKTGKVLGRADWQLPQEMARVTQPALVGATDVLIGTGFSFGTRRVHVTPGGDGWTSSEVWTSTAIKPYYNDLVIHQDHLYGFDGIFFTCVSLPDGQGRWRTRGYGNGQVLLLADQGLLLVLSEKGEAVLLEANPEKHTVHGRFQAIKGKTWNHPVVAHGKLFVRNGEEAACYDVGEGAPR